MRPQSRFFRELEPAEGERLKWMAQTAKHRSIRQRAAILLASATRMSGPKIAHIAHYEARGAGDPAIAD